MGRDILSSVLGAVRLSGAVFFDVAASSPWVAEAPPASMLAKRVLPGAQHVMEYHVVTSGCGWATVVDTDVEPVRLGPGSVVMFPQGDGHTIASSPGMRAKPDLSVYDQPEELPPPFYLEQFGGGQDETRLICGFLGCDRLPFNPVIQSLPRIIHIADGYTAGDGWLSSLIKAIMKESAKQRLGAESVLSKLSELIFIEVVRCYMESLPRKTLNWFTALSDPHVGRAIRLMHGDIRRPWTLEELAREVGTSRTILIERFKTYLDVAPMSYLFNWRMQIAAGMLAGDASSLSRIATNVGYESETAFSRAFKRATGMPPAAWRAQAATSPTIKTVDKTNQQPVKN
jgi:AraC-like DNA-binding protein